MGVSCSRNGASSETVAAGRVASPPRHNSLQQRGTPTQQLVPVAKPALVAATAGTTPDMGELSILSSGWCDPADLASLGGMLKEHFLSPYLAFPASAALSTPQFEDKMYQWCPQKNDDDDDDDSPFGHKHPHPPAGVPGDVVDVAPFLTLQRALLACSLVQRCTVVGHAMHPTSPIVDYGKETQALKQRQPALGCLLEASQRYFVSNERRAKLYAVGSSTPAGASTLLAGITAFATQLSATVYGVVEACGAAVAKQMNGNRRRGGCGSGEILACVQKSADAWLEKHAAAGGAQVQPIFAGASKGAPVTMAASAAFKLLLALGGGVASLLADDRRLVSTAEGVFACSSDDGDLMAALTVDAVNHIVSLSKLAGFDGYSGMHTTEAAEEWIACLRHMFVVCGALPPQLSTRARPDFPLVEWINLLPMFALCEGSRQGLTYLFAIVAGQQRLVIQPVMRGNVLAHVAQALQHNPATQALYEYTTHASSGTRFVPSSSHKVFPLFATEGIGLESGEGHGPRKELFDSIGVDVTAKQGPPLDLSSAVSVTILSGLRELNSTRVANGQVVPTGAGSVCMLTWKQPKLLKRFQQGDKLNASMVLQPSSSSGRTSSIGSVGPGGTVEQHAITECWAVQKEIDAVQSNETILLLVAPTRLPQGYRLQSLLVFQKRDPLFVHDEGEQYAWLNPSLTGGDVAAAQLWASGWALANAIPNGLMLAAPLPPLLFYFLRLFDTSTMRFSSDVRQAIQDKMGLLTLNLLKPSVAASAKQVQELSDRDFADLVLADGMDPLTTRAQFIHETIVKGSVWCCDSSTEATMKHVESFCRGFFSSSAASCPALLYSCSSKRLLRYLCAPVDDGSEDFSFQEHFRLVEAAEFTQFPHSRVFRELFFQSLEEHDVPMKRQLLKFITGRVLLPHQPKAEHIKVEFPFSPMSAREFDAAMTRLPSSHSCDNVLEMPDYLECCLFGSKSPFYALAGKAVNGVILDDAKERVWGLLSPEQRRSLTSTALDIMRTKLVLAVEMSGTYELDDGAIRPDVREAFDKQHMRPGSAYDGNAKSLPRLASSSGMQSEMRPDSPNAGSLRARTPSFFTRPGSRPGSHRGLPAAAAPSPPVRASFRLNHKAASSVNSDDDESITPPSNILAPSNIFAEAHTTTVVLGYNRPHSQQWSNDVTPTRASGRPPQAVVTSSQRLSVFSKANDMEDDIDTDDVLAEPPSGGSSVAQGSNTQRAAHSGERDDKPPLAVGGFSPGRVRPPVPASPQPKRSADLDDIESELFGRK